MKDTYKKDFLHSSLRARRSIDFVGYMAALAVVG